MQGKAYWISPKGEIIEVRNKHISYVRDNLEKFNLTRKEFETYFDKYGENYTSEGKGRNDLIIDLSKSGWIRIRDWINGGWSIELWELTTKSKNYIFDWAVLVSGLSEKEFPTTEVKINQYKYFKENTPIELFQIKTTIGEILEGKLSEKRVLTYDEYLSETNNLF